MSTNTTEKNESGPLTEMQNLGRRKLLQALAATSGVAVLGGLKLDLNWEAPFVEVSQIQAQAHSYGPPTHTHNSDGTVTVPNVFYTLEKQYAAAKTREDFFAQAEPTQAAKRKLIDTSTPGKDSPHVVALGSSASGIYDSPGILPYFSVTKGLVRDQGARLDLYDFGLSFYSIKDGKIGRIGVAGATDRVGSEIGFANDSDPTRVTEKLEFQEKTIGSTYTFTFIQRETKKRHEVEMGIGKDADLLGVDKGNFVIAIMSLVEISD